MTKPQAVKDREGTWLFLAPVKDLILTEATDFEFRIDKVTFVDATKLAHRRTRYGFPSPISELRNRYKGGIDSFFEGQKTYATLRMTGKGSETKTKCIKIINDELSILALSQLGYSKRRNNSFPTLSEEHAAGKRRCLMINTSETSSYQPNEVVGKIGPLVLEPRWKQYQKRSFFYDLIKIISGDVKVSSNWRKSITNAAILAGQSQCRQDIPQCFLWNMIALETLLTNSDDQFLKKFPERAEAFIGWTQDWSNRNYAGWIKNVYEKRCQFVHAGKREQITISDILFTDDLFLNVLDNIVKHPALFKTKKDVIEFSEKVQAEHLLGIKSKTQPKTFVLSKPYYSTSDFENI